MRLVLTLVCRDFDSLQRALPEGLEAIAAAGAPVSDMRQLGAGAMDLFTEGAEPTRLAAAARRVLGRQPVDVCVQPAEDRFKRLLVADMDSTIINCECLDELADLAGQGAAVAAVTARAMSGELDFEAALTERVRRLAGASSDLLDRVWRERVALSAGARTLVQTMAAGGATCVLVSGGFTFFTSRVREAAGFADHRANRLILEDGRLTGEVARPILGREAKLEVLNEESRRLGLPLEATLAVGDGANDLAMIAAAGLGVAYRAKPIVAEAADARIDHTDLTALLYFQGIEQSQFVVDEP